jgi:hypothetical protein
MLANVGFGVLINEGRIYNLAKIALSVGDRQEALRQWRTAMVRYPTFVKR